MPSVRAYERVALVGSTGKPLGTIAAVLFHPSEPRVIGFEVDPGSMLGVIDRRRRYVRLPEAAPSPDGTLRLVSPALPSDGAGERALGFTWDESVVWQGMPVRSSAGEAVGAVHDVGFDAASGEVRSLTVSTGVVGDVALGRLEVPAELVERFDGEAVVVRPGYNDIRAAGGAAKLAASGATALKARGGKVAEGALDVGVAAAHALGRSIKRGTARKAIDRLKALMDDEDE